MSWDNHTETLRHWSKTETLNGRKATAELLRDAASEIDSLRRSLDALRKNSVETAERLERAIAGHKETYGVAVSRGLAVAALERQLAECRARHEETAYLYHAALARIEELNR